MATNNLIKIVYDSKSKEHVLIAKNKYTVILKDNEKEIKVINSFGTYSLKFTGYSSRFERIHFTDEQSNNISASSTSFGNDFTTIQSALKHTKFIWLGIDRKIYRYMHDFFLEDYLKDELKKNYTANIIIYHDGIYRLDFYNKNYFFNNDQIIELDYQLTLHKRANKHLLFDYVVFVFADRISVFSFSNNLIKVQDLTKNIKNKNLPITIYRSSLTDSSMIFLNYMIRNFI